MTKSTGVSLPWNMKVGLHKDVRSDKKSWPLNRAEEGSNMIQVEPEQTSTNKGGRLLQSQRRFNSSSSFTVFFSTAETGIKHMWHVKVCKTSDIRMV